MPSGTLSIALIKFCLKRSASTGITEDLVKVGFEAGRMKTGTPPRVDGRSLDFSKMIEQPGDDNPEKFSFLETTEPLKKQRSCYMSYTSQEVHDLLRTGFDRSPMFNGRIQSIGPRYCPSIEDKIDRFASKDRHQLFVEPEGWDTVEIYVNGFSTSLPEDVQDKALRKVAGFENVKHIPTVSKHENVSIFSCLESFLHFVHLAVCRMRVCKNVNNLLLCVECVCCVKNGHDLVV